jgi:alcohol dehydrogenase (cytochrome c)
MTIRGKKTVSALALIAAAAAPILWQAGAVAQTAAGPFTVEQATAGRAAYVANCMACHQANMAGEGDALPLAGKTFIKAWANRTSKDLYDTIRTSMPYGNGGSLDANTYSSLVAFILQSNGALAGSDVFTPTTAVKIGTVATGAVPSDVVRGLQVAREGAAGAPAARGTRAGVPPRDRPPPRGDNGAGMIRSFGQTMVGDIKNYAPVTQEMLTHPPDSDWLMGRRNYAGWSYSPLSQINGHNVKTLQLQWVWAMNEGGANETTPLVHNGVMFLGNTYNTIQALDAKTGELLWENRVGPGPSRPNYGGMRSIAVWGDKVYFAANNAVLHALDARTGKLVWSTPLSDVPGHDNTSGVLAVHGKILTGLTGCGTIPAKDHCYISAYDAETGKQLWKFVTVALTGKPNGNTWGGLPDDQRAGAETWIAGSYDPVLNLTYWGTAQAKPWRRDLRGSKDGATDYANSTVALDADTGELKWFYNHAPGESLDLDEVFERILIDHGDQKTVMTTGKAGILWKLDRASGKYLDSKETVFQNVFSAQNPVTGELTYRPEIRSQKTDQWLSSCPGPEGGKDWQAASYHQPTDTMILPLSQSCVMMLGNGSQTYFEMPGTERNMGRLSAYETATMKPIWSFQQRAPFLSAVLSTGGNLAFVGDFDRTFRAVDVSNGKTLWKVRLGTTVQGYPITFSVDGRQYIAVTSGLGGGSPQAKPTTLLSGGAVHRPNNGHALYVFALPDDK